MNKAWLKGQMFGMPRWAWLSLLLAGLAIGLYLRSRSDDTPVDEEELPPDPSTLDANYSDGGLAGVGVLGPPGGTVVPVQAPYLPDGIVDILSSLTFLSADLGRTLGDVYLGGGGGGLMPELDLTGGGAPGVPDGAHAPAKQCSAGDRANIARLTGEIQILNARLNHINNTALPNANKEFQKARSQRKSGEGWRREIERLQGLRQSYQSQRDYKQARRAPLQAKCS